MVAFLRMKQDPVTAKAIMTKRVTKVQIIPNTVVAGSACSQPECVCVCVCVIMRVCHDVCEPRNRNDLFIQTHGNAICMT